MGDVAEFVYQYLRTTLTTEQTNAINLDRICLDHLLDKLKRLMDLEKGQEKDAPDAGDDLEDAGRVGDQLQENGENDNEEEMEDDDRIGDQRQEIGESDNDEEMEEDNEI